MSVRTLSEETGIILSTSAVIGGKNNASTAATQSRRLETATSARKAALSAVTQHAGETRPSPDNVFRRGLQTKRIHHGN